MKTLTKVLYIIGKIIVWIVVLFIGLFLAVFFAALDFKSDSMPGVKGPK